MKQFLHNLLCTASALALTSTAWAADVVTIDDINYSLSSSSATVDESPSASGAVTIPASVTYEGKTYEVSAIGEEAFKGCSGVTSVTIAEGVSAIRSGAFSGCTGLTSVSIPTSVTSISNSVFASCTSLASVTLPEGLTSLGNYVFSNCTSLTSLSIPSTLKSMGNNSITSCKALTNITVAEGSTYFALSDGGLYELTDGAKTKLVFCLPSTEGDFVIADGVAEIAPNAFSATTKVTSVFVPESVKEIGESAFKGEGIAKLTLESATPPSLGKYAINSSKTVIRVPYEAIETYQKKWGTGYTYVKLPTFSAGAHVSIVSYEHDEDAATASVVVTFEAGYVFSGATISGDAETKVSATCADGVVSISGVTGTTYIIGATDVARSAVFKATLGGTVTVSAYAGASATVSVVADDGYKFVSASRGGETFDISLDDKGTATITGIVSDEIFLFSFTDVANGASFTAGEHGSVEATISGATASVTITPDDGYAFTYATKNDVTLDGVAPVDGVISLTGVTSTDEYFFRFTDIAALADFWSGENGTTEETIDRTTATVKVIPNEGYELDQITKNGETLDVTPDDNGQIVFTDVAVGDQFVFTFKAKKATRIVSPVAGDEGSAVFDIMGHRATKSAESLPRGMYVVVSGGEARKVVVR